MKSSEARLSADDRFAITALIHRYCWLIDAGDFDGLGQLFAQAEVHYGGGEVFRQDPDGIAAVQRRFVRLYPESGTPRTRHACTNIIIMPEPGGAAAISVITVWQATPDFPLQAIVGASYRDRFACDAGGWHFTERHVDVEMIGDISAHLLHPIGG